MFVLGLTGSIAMGKTWGAKCFRQFGVPVHDADACVHDLMRPNGPAVADIAQAFAGVLNKDGGIDRAKLSDLVFADEAALKTLEAIIHPLVRQSQRRFLARHCRAGTPLVVLDVPLLYETQGRACVDAAVVMSAPAFLQRQRVLRRRGMSLEKLNAILDRQIPDDVKRRVAEYVVLTHGPRGQSLRAVLSVVKVLRTQNGSVWGPSWGL
jgi:dephospho-CoA kinase